MFAGVFYFYLFIIIIFVIIIIDGYTNGRTLLNLQVLGVGFYRYSLTTYNTIINFMKWSKPLNRYVSKIKDERYVIRSSW